MITHTLSQVIFKPHIRINIKLTFNNLHNSASPISWKVCVVPSPISIQIPNSLFLIQGFLHLNLIENTDFFLLNLCVPYDSNLYLTILFLFSSTHSFGTLFVYLSWSLFSLKAEGKSTVLINLIYYHCIMNTWVTIFNFF